MNTAHLNDSVLTALLYAIGTTKLNHLKLCTIAELCIGGTYLDVG